MPRQITAPGPTVPTPRTPQHATDVSLRLVTHGHGAGETRRARPARCDRAPGHITTTRHGATRREPYVTTIFYFLPSTLMRDAPKYSGMFLPNKLPKFLGLAAVTVTLVLTMTACQPATYTKPPSGKAWHIQLTTPVDMNEAAPIYDIDGYENSASVVSQLKAKGKYLVCYIDLGSIENYRPDYADFPRSALSNANPEWPDEQWLNILRLDDVGPTGKTPRQLLQARIDMCKDKGFDAIDPDMIEVYAASGVTFTPASRKITYADQITFNRWIADEAHARGMAVGLKGDIEQAKDLAPYFDFSVNEECHAYSECAELAGFTAAGKPVLNIEYAGTDSKFLTKTCPAAKSEGFYSVKKKMSLNAWKLECPS